MKRYHYRTITSTNDAAKDLLTKDSPVFVTADYQSCGKGRNSKNWYGNPGENIYCSLGISIDRQMPVEEMAVYQAIGTLAAKHALTEVTGSRMFILKYPNDIMARCPDGKFRKICGVLAENGFIGSLCTYSIIGIGINVKQTVFVEEISNSATSLKLLSFNVSINLLTDLLEKYLEDLLKLSYNAIFGIWRDELNIEGKEITITDVNGIWIVDKMLDDGRLLALNVDSQQPRIIDNGNSIRYSLE